MEIIMKKTAFDKIVVGFVVLVVIIFALLMVYSISTAQNSVLSERKSTMKNEITMLADGAMTDYSNGTIDSKELYKELQHAADTLDMGIWLTDERSNIIFRSGSSSGSSESGGSSKDSDSHSSTNDNLKNYVEPDELFASFCFEDTFGGYFSEDTLVIGQPLYSWNNYMGTIILTSPMTFKQDIKSRMLSTTFVPFLILMLIAMIALMLMSNSLLKPIREIIKTSKSYAQGNFNARVNVTAKNEFGELARYMEEMADELSRSNEYRKSFISNISHDFRSPLTSIKGYIEAMLDGTIPSEMHEKYITSVLNETERLTKLTNSLLTLNNLNTKGMLLDKTDFDINQVIRNTASTFEGTCHNKSIAIEMILTGNEMYVHADMGKIQQVLYNLMDNAIKFSHHDSVIHIETSEKKNKLFVSVKDTGIGIPKEDLKLIWDRFYKSDLSRGKDKKGTGLGLSIVKEIINAHDEHINVISTPGVGSEFIFSLPKSHQEDEED